MTKILLLIAAFLTVLMVTAVLLYQYFGVWGLIGAVLLATLTLASLPRMFAWFIVRSLRKTMTAHAIALRGATVEVHRVESAPEPPPDEYDEEHGYGDDEPAYLDHENDDQDEERADEDEYRRDRSEPFDADAENLFYDGVRNWYYVDMTVYPAMRKDGRATEYLPWSPQMISFHGPPRPASKEFNLVPFPEMADGCCEVHEALPWGEEKTDNEDTSQVFGPQRLRMHIGIQPKIKKLRIMYVCETIGELSIPHN